MRGSLSRSLCAGYRPGGIKAAAEPVEAVSEFYLVRGGPRSARHGIVRGASPLDTGAEGEGGNRDSHYRKTVGTLGKMIRDAPTGSMLWAVHGRADTMFDTTQLNAFLGELAELSPKDDSEQELDSVLQRCGNRDPPTRISVVQRGLKQHTDKIRSTLRIPRAVPAARKAGSSVLAAVRSSPTAWLRCGARAAQGGGVACAPPGRPRRPRDPVRGCAPPRSTPSLLSHRGAATRCPE